MLNFSEDRERSAAARRRCLFARQGTGGTGGRVPIHGSDSTGLVSLPIFSISIETLSPGLSQRGGFAAIPTPCGVPVRIVVPGSSVVLPLKNSMIEGTSKIMSFVFQSWTAVPFRMVRMVRALGLGISSGVTRHGPSGQKESNDFPRLH